MLKLSTILIGAGEGGLDRQKCAQALLQAVDEAHAVLTKLKLKPRLDELEIVELYEDRAYATWRAIAAALKTDRTLNSNFKLSDKLRRPVGSRRSGPVGSDPTWWQPIQITMSDDPNGDPNLSFTIGGGLARAEARTIAANLELVAPLVRRTSRTTVDDSTRNSPGRALFELLWPASLKDQSADERPRRLTLDERSAAFPWELLDDRRPWLSDAEAEKRPPAVRAGLVRQLLQTQFREDIVPRRGVAKGACHRRSESRADGGFQGAQRRAGGSQSSRRASERCLRCHTLDRRRCGAGRDLPAALYGGLGHHPHICARGFKPECCWAGRNATETDRRRARRRRRTHPVALSPNCR